MVFRNPYKILFSFTSAKRSVSSKKVSRETMPRPETAPLAFGTRAFSPARRPPAPSRRWPRGQLFLEDACRSAHNPSRALNPHKLLAGASQHRSCHRSARPPNRPGGRPFTPELPTEFHVKHFRCSSTQDMAVSSYCCASWATPHAAIPQSKRARTTSNAISHSSRRLLPEPAGLCSTEARHCLSGLEGVWGRPCRHAALLT